MTRQFTVYPAIDVLGGRVVRLREGRREHVTVEGGDPVAAAEQFAAAGAVWLHLVDLDGAFDGRPDLGLLRRGGGVRRPPPGGGGHPAPGLGAAGDLSPRGLAGRCAAAGVARLVVTATHRDGTLAGPDRALLADVLGAGLPVIAAGGGP